MEQQLHFWPVQMEPAPFIPRPQVPIVTGNRWKYSMGTCYVTKLVAYDVTNVFDRGGQLKAILPRGVLVNAGFTLWIFKLYRMEVMNHPMCGCFDCFFSGNWFRTKTRMWVKRLVLQWRSS